MDATLTRKKVIAEDTYELEFDLDGAVLDFAAGQYCRIALPRVDFPHEKSSRKFSFVNAPQDNGRVVISTRTGITGYKNALFGLEPGDPVRVEKVKGKLVLPDRPRRPIVFIAGGIGIVPFISMLRDLDQRDWVDDITLLYFNRTPESAAYLSELQEMSRRRPGLQLVLSMTRHETWDGETERLGAPMLTRLLGDPRRHEYYVVGTPAMVQSTLTALQESGIPRKRIHDEDFSGYDG